jgi:hypothetical protein
MAWAFSIFECPLTLGYYLDNLDEAHLWELNESLTAEEEMLV